MGVGGYRNLEGCLRPSFQTIDFASCSAQRKRHGRRLISVSDDTELSDLHDVFQQVLGWSGELGYAFRIHGREFAWAVVALPGALRWAQGLLSYSNVSGKMRPSAIRP